MQGLGREGVTFFHGEPFVVMNKKDKRCFWPSLSVAGRALVVRALLHVRIFDLARRSKKRLDTEFR